MLEVFLDENRDSPRLVAALEKRGVSVHRHRDSFPRGTEDEICVPEVVSRGWVIVTTDRGRGDRIMLMVLEQTRATALIFSSRVPPDQCAEAIGIHERKIRRVIERYEPPIVLYISRSEVRVEHLREGRREIENSTARLGATTGGALARLTREGDASAIERRLHETFLRIGKHEEHFDTKLADLRPLVQRYLRLAKESPTAYIGRVTGTRRFPRGLGMLSLTHPLCVYRAIPLGFPRVVVFRYRLLASPMRRSTSWLTQRKSSWRNTAERI
ncbi:MAG: hypothetical protein AAGF11_16915 [Myxococcota bacterium]